MAMGLAAAGPTMRIAATLADAASSQPATTASQPAIDYSTLLTGDWWGAREKLADDGVSIGGTLTLEGFYNSMGGIKVGAAGSTTFDLSTTLDLQKLANITGGEIYFDLEDHAFADPTDELVGDIQEFGKLNAPPYFQVNELWYQQILFGGMVRVKIGKVDANNEFCVIDNGGPFVSDFGQEGGTIFPLPTSPDSMPSVNLILGRATGFYASVGAYYSNRSDSFGNFSGHTQLELPTRYGAFLIGETGYRWDSLGGLKYAGNFKVGAWGQTGEFERLDHTQQDGTAGGYAVLNQTLYQPLGEPPDGRGVRTFLQYGGTESHISEVDEQVAGGVSWTGPIQSRAGYCGDWGGICPD